VSIDKIIQHLIDVETMAEATRIQAYRTRIQLERFHAPAPKRVKKELDIVKKYRESLLKKHAKANIINS
jgi:aspartate carbamoyltransferase catalytic subunit